MPDLHRLILLRLILLSILSVLASLLVDVPARADVQTFTNPTAMTVPASGTSGPAAPYLRPELEAWRAAGSTRTWASRAASPRSGSSGQGVRKEGRPAKVCRAVYWRAGIAPRPSLTVTLAKLTDPSTGRIRADHYKRRVLRKDALKRIHRRFEPLSHL
jgi:hypothetical protein